MAKEFDLGELLKNVPKLDTVREQIEYIRLELLDQDPNNFYRLSDVEQLADNISLCGLQQPIRVRPVPGESGRYVIVSGHRRRAAVELLAKEDPERWAEVPCIVEADAVSPSLQQLRLIYANANTRTMTSAEISEQAVQVEKLLYQLKEEGYEFPGRMRDHVAQAVSVSKSKLARLKVIRERLSYLWKKPFERGELDESPAYCLAQMPLVWQEAIYAVNGLYPQSVTEPALQVFKERFAAIDEVECKLNGTGICINKSEMREKSCKDRWADPCHSHCCFECANLRLCGKSCINAAEKKKTLKESAKQEAEAKAEADKPAVDQISALWQRFGLAREMASKDFSDCKQAVGICYFPYDDEQALRLECGEAKISPNTKLPFGYSCYLPEINRLIALADMFGCSLDWLLCRTEDMRPVAGWQTGDPWNFGEYVVLVRYDSARGSTPEKMSWTEDGWEMLGTAFGEVCPDAVVLGWMPMIEESEAPATVDDTLKDAIDVIRETGVASVSMLQRRLKIGYAAASDLMDQLEKAGVVGPYNGSSPREVLIDAEVAEK